MKKIIKLLLENAVIALGQELQREKNNREATLVWRPEVGVCKPASDLYGHSENGCNPHIHHGPKTAETTGPVNDDYYEDFAFRIDDGELYICMEKPAKDFYTINQVLAGSTPIDLKRISVLMLFKVIENLALSNEEQQP